MTVQEKRRFITELCNNVRDEILQKAENMPEEWNGIELRRYIAERFESCIMRDMMTRKAIRDYNSEVYSRNL